MFSIFLSNPNNMNINLNISLPQYIHPRIMETYNKDNQA